MSKTNTVTISESCLSALPSGIYHHSIFEGIDIFQHKKPMNLQKMRDEIEESESEVARLTKREELLEEQLHFASELICEMQQSLRLNNSALSKKLKALIEDSSFEV